jgi:hypothetical protein
MRIAIIGVNQGLALLRFQATYQISAHSLDSRLTAEKERIGVTPTAIREGTTREELKARRNRLFQKFLNSPSDVHLALELKDLDDQLADSADRLEPRKKSHARQSPKALVG